MEKGVKWVFGAAPKILLSRGGAVLKTHIVVGAFQNRQVVITYLRRTTSGFGIILTWTNGQWTCHDYPSWKRDWVQSQNDENLLAGWAGWSTISSTHLKLADLDGQLSRQFISRLQTEMDGWSLVRDWRKSYPGNSSHGVQSQCDELHGQQFQQSQSDESYSLDGQPSDQLVSRLKAERVGWSLVRDGRKS